MNSLDTTPRLARGMQLTQPAPWTLWLPLLAGLAVIACESTGTMGAAHTQQWLTLLFDRLGQASLAPEMPEINHILRKSGHFFGYGSLGVLFARFWLPVLVSRGLAAWHAPRLRAAGLAVLSTFTVACADEWHQAFLPGRTSKFTDVLLDTSGAVLLNGIYFAYLWAERRRRVEGEATLRDRVSARMAPALAWPGAEMPGWQSYRAMFTEAAVSTAAHWREAAVPQRTLDEFARLWAATATEHWTERVRRMAVHGGRRLLRAENEAESNLRLLQRH